MPRMCQSDGTPAAGFHSQQDTKGGTLYQTNREAEAEAVVRILHEMTDRFYRDICVICGYYSRPGFVLGHGESCPFQMADEFIAKYGTHPPKEPKVK